MVAKGVLLKLKRLLRIFSNDLDIFIHILKYIHVFHFGFEVNCKEHILKCSS